MVINKKMFHLGNKVVDLSEKLNDSDMSDSLRSLLMYLLKIVNEIRLELSSYPEESELKQCKNVNINCSDQEWLAIKKQFELLGYDIQETK